jgi:hypothetical protein
VPLALMRSDSSLPTCLYSNFRTAPLCFSLRDRAWLTQHWYGLGVETNTAMPI